MDIINPQMKEIERRHEELRDTVFQMRGEIDAIKFTTSDNTRHTIWQFVIFSVTMAGILIGGIKYQSDVLRNEMDIRFGAMEKRMEQSEQNMNARFEDFKQEIRSELRELKEGDSRFSQKVSRFDMADEAIRLSKLMAQQGICSRREADALIEKGLVLVDGVVVDQLGTKVPPTVKITLAPQAIKDRNPLATIILNKPIGYVSAQPEPGYIPAIKLITPSNMFGQSDLRLKPEHLKGLAAAGRLDIDSQGLLLFTQDGRIAKMIVGENSEIEKEYIVRVSGALPEKKLELLRHGLSLDGKKLRPAQVEWINNDQLRFILKEGKKRQIRRMCELVGLRVAGLKRVRIGNLKLGNLPEGKWRFLKPDESL